jgi:hypothetical protein
VEAALLDGTSLPSKPQREFSINTTGTKRRRTTTHVDKGFVLANSEFTPFEDAAVLELEGEDWEGAPCSNTEIAASTFCDGVSEFFLNA